jgi:hypothetical protein
VSSLNLKLLSGYLLVVDRYIKAWTLYSQFGPYHVQHHMLLRTVSPAPDNLLANHSNSHKIQQLVLLHRHVLRVAEKPEINTLNF